MAIDNVPGLSGPMLKELRETQRKLRECREALEFYAKAIYRDRSGVSVVVQSVFDDAGERARDALEDKQ